MVIECPDTVGVVWERSQLDVLQMECFCINDDDHVVYGMQMIAVVHRM